MDVQRDFKVRPPKEPLTTLAAFVRDFQWRFPRDRRDMVVEYCREAPDFEEAVQRAVLSRNASGKMHNHQSRVKEWDRIQFGMRIRAHHGEQHWREEIRARRSGSDGLKVVASPRAFDLLHHRFDELKPKGIGPVTVYDVATRVGAYLGVEPQSLYLHAGVRDGYRSLLVALNRGEPGGPMTRTYKEIKADVSAAYIRREGWPAPLRALTADEAEDFCCTYRTEFLKYPSRLEAGE